MRARLLCRVLSEGLPVVVMEAMAHRKPVVAPWLAGIPELVVDAETGWLYPCGDIDLMAAAICACLAASPATLAEMGAAGSRAVRVSHDVDIEAAKLAKLFTNSD